MHTHIYTHVYDFTHVPPHTLPHIHTQVQDWWLAAKTEACTGRAAYKKCLRTPLQPVLTWGEGSYSLWDVKGVYHVWSSPLALSRYGCSDDLCTGDSRVGCSANFRRTGPSWKKSPGVSL